MLLNVGALQPAGTSAVTASEHHPSHSDTHMQNAICRDKTEISENPKPMNRCWDHSPQLECFPLSLHHDQNSNFPVICLYQQNSRKIILWSVCCRTQQSVTFV